MKKILVLCTGNSCRSQMAQGYLQHFAGDRAAVYSAGIETHGVNPMAVRVMNEDRIDISHHTSNHVDEYRDIAFDFVITVCDNANEHCPVFISKNPRVKRFHHNFPDPAKAGGTELEMLREFRKVREMIRLYCKDFVNDYL